ncbi:SDR family NAD(P)-dependent oxidoreductase [Sporanaerobacter sp. PP17-6a]|jgi:3-oxoacyl-[acyl-carrier protein] reductase|uniref:SDR family NAD(P)-dependent oxidoreductase n=1 Tax=Sporanaerobacter sp. PP17-6a TaxID=1891289 RepID=UPI0008A0792B|nr:glucose 1-dehydrogenase [Sporanaerobacter sp. PP17-6a]SCL95908.1 3-oxoacyl-[acyl-carrier-protein] reductase FabG [Sporanaerobacter sp. PP17-6a]
MKLNNKVAIVTGAAAGMGKAIAKEFAKEGAKVVVNYSRSSQEAGAIVDEIIKDGGEAVAVKADVSKSEDVKQMIEKTIDKFGKIDILVNNAGILDDYTPVVDTSEELWNRIIGVNLKGPFLCSKYAIPYMLKEKKGVIINLSSIAGFVSGGGGAAYTSSKHGVIGLTKQIAYDYGKLGIRANAICPGAIKTRMTEEILKNDDAPVMEAIKSVPAGRYGYPEEIAKLALFLASDDSDFIHGTPILIDGGWVAR